MGFYREFLGEGEALEEDATFLRELLENTSEGLLTIDTDSVIVFANPAVEDILGYAPEELVGSSKMKIIPEHLRSAHVEGLEQYVETGEKHFDWDGVELPALHKDGHRVPVSVSLREHEYRGERLFTGIFTDISERKRRERELREQTAELEEFADVLSHDLRAPLDAAQSHLRNVRDVVDEDAAEDVRAVEDALTHIDRIIEDTLVRTRGHAEADTVETLRLAEELRAAWTVVDTDDATLVLPDGAWFVRARSARFRQLAEHLFRNCIEHGGPDVTVRVGILDDGEGFYVADDGPGFPSDILQPEGAATSAPGRYGLSIAGTIANEHGWAMRLGDADDGGARVEFTDVTLVER
ncbi:sensor histidine kinase [Halarchaeum sp. P4]|uniref:sensor histidine kinase n=1 Tax=Halarchaeum sp. P4 TaxID=3421639 RepID=UPI003EB8DA93